MIDFLLKRPVAVSMFYLSVVILGVISYQNLSVEGQPDTEMPQIVVQTGWGSTSPEVVQIFLTSPIEEAAAQVEGLEEMLSSSGRGTSTVTCKFNRDTDMEFARLDLNERLSVLRSDLPLGANQPTLSVSEQDENSTARFMSFDVSGPYDLQRLTEIFTDYLRDEVSSIDGVADLRVLGEREKTLRVRLNRESMELYGLVPDTVTSKIAQLTRTYDTPRTDMGNMEFTMLISNSIESLASVEDMVVAKYRDQMVRLKDVGTVELGFARVTSMARLNGNPTLHVTIEREVGASVIKTSKLVKKRINSILDTMPSGFRLDWNDDEGKMMEEELHSVYKRGLWCILLIVVLLLLFMQSVSAAGVITLNILFSVLITVNFMYYFGVTFNMVTLSGLAIGFGMLVDNAIVVLENIFRLRELGHSRMSAAIHGVKDVMWAVFAATLTTVCALMCMVLLKDRLAVTYMPLAVAVIFSLSASLVVSFTFTPLLSLLIRGSNLTRPIGERNFISRGITRSIARFTGAYGSVVRWSLHHKMLIVLLVTAVMVQFGLIFKNEIDTGGWNFFGNSDERVVVYVRMPEGAELETADEVIKQFEAPLLEVQGYRDVSVQVFSNFAVLEVSFEADKLRSAFPLALKAKLIGVAQGFAGVGISVMGINADDNYYSGTTGYETYNSSIRVMGYNYKDLMNYANDIIKTVKRERRVKTTKLETSRRFRSRDQTETTMLIDREALRHFDIDVVYLMGYIQRNLRLENRDLTKYRGEEMRLEVKFEDAEEFDLKDLEALVITTPDQKRIRLADLVTIEERKVSGAIDRKDQQYSVNVRWDYKGSPKRARRYNEKIFNSLHPPAGYKAEMDFARFMTEEETSNLVNVALLASLVVFMIMAALYESIVDPFVIFLTLPLSGVGVAWIYWYTGNSFDSTAYIGLVILAGIVVNNSILLISHINFEVRRMKETGRSFTDAITKACEDRLRPILLTAITTIVGLLPLLEEFVIWFKYNAFSSLVLSTLGIDLPAVNLENRGLQQTLGMFASLSRSTVGGMLSATLSTLLVIPVIYTIAFRLKQWVHLRINEIFNMAAPQVDEEKAGQVTTG